MSDETARLIDEEVRRIVENAHDLAFSLLESHLDQLHLMAGALMKYETIDGRQIDQIMEGREPDPPDDWGEVESTHPAGSEGGEEGHSPIGGPAEQV